MALSPGGINKMADMNDRDDTRIVEIAVGFKPIKLDEVQRREISDTILALLSSYGVEFYVDNWNPNGYVDFRTQWVCDMSYDGG